MHRILSKNSGFTKARTEYEQAERNLDELVAKVRAAHTKHEASKKAALDKGEVYAPPLEPIPSREVEEHVRNRKIGTAREYARVVRELAQPLRVEFQAEQDALLAKALTTPAGGLQPIADELSSLLDAWAYVDDVADALVHQRDTISRDVPEGPAVAVLDVLAAATGERSLIEARALTTAASEEERVRREQLARIRG
jgi:hypothetical protein